MKYIILVLFVILFFQSCTNDNVTAYKLEEGDLTISSESIDFGTIDSVKSLQINIKSGKKIKWMLSVEPSNRWIELDIEHSFNSEKVQIKINRNYLPIGVSSDSLIIVGVSALDSDSLSNKLEPIQEIKKTVMIHAERIANYSEIINQLIGNNVFIHNFYIDPTYNFNASFAIEKGCTIKTAFASFFKSKPFVDAGSQVIFKGKPHSNPELQTILAKKSFNFTYNENNYSALYYMPETRIYNSDLSRFDDYTLHNFYISGGAVIDSAYQDSILSVSVPSWKNPALLVSKSSDLIVQWTKTKLNDDIVFVVLHSKNDTNVRISPVFPVSDDEEIITIPKEYIAKLYKSSSEASLWLIRLRVNKYNDTRRILYVQAQNHYTFRIN